MLQILQLLGNKSLAVRQSLLANVGFRNEVIVGLADLNIVAKYFVVANFQALNACFFFLTRLYFRDNAFTTVQNVAQTVHFVVVVVADEATLTHGERRFVHNGGTE